MKYFLTILLTLALLMTACGETAPDPSQTSSPVVSEENVDVSPDESSEESRKEWTETETMGDNIITREYRDGRNDYTVTVDTYKDKRLTAKEIRVMSHSVTLMREEWRYNEDGGIDSYTLNEYDKNGNPVRHAAEYTYSAVIYKSEGAYDENGKSFGTDRYENHDGKLLAEGAFSHETIDEKLYAVTTVAVYADSGEIDHIETHWYADDLSGYSYWEYADAESNVLYSLKITPDAQTCFRAGERGGALEIIGTEYTFFEQDGTWIAHGFWNGSTVELDEYNERFTLDEVLARVSDMLAYISAPQTFFLMSFRA